MPDCSKWPKVELLGLYWYFALIGGVKKHFYSSLDGAKVAAPIRIVRRRTEFAYPQPETLLCCQVALT